MSKYDEAIRTKMRNDRIIAAFENQVTTGSRDKTGLHWHLVKEGERSLLFETDMYSGYFGKSSVSSDRSKDAATELAKTLDSLKGEIIRRTIDRLKKETLTAMREAKMEAEGVIRYADHETAELTPVA